MSPRGKPDMLPFCHWLETNSLIVRLDTSIVWSSICEILHYSGFFLVVGSTVIVNLRLLGLAGKKENPSALAEQLVPWMWIGLAMTILSGFVLFAGEATDFYNAITFRIKILWILVATIVGAIVFRKSRQWGEMPSVPMGAKLVAFISLVLWIGAILISVEVPAISGVG
jgi:hypothetical protein